MISFLNNYMDYASILLEIQESNAFPIKKCDNNYTELAKVSPNKFGIHLTTIDGDDFGVGDSDEKFSIQVFQSVNRPLAFFFGMKEYGKSRRRTFWYCF
jgi:glutaminase